MKRRLAWWAITALTFCVPGPADAAPARAAVATPFTILHVRIYDTARRPHEQLAKASTEATALLSSVGVNVDWADCSAAAAIRSCAEPLGASEVALRVVPLPTPPQYHGQLPLGDSLIDHELRTGVLATIYYDRVDWLAHAADVPVTPVLARAIAHEIAHLLIGSHFHGESGLMRPIWSREDLHRSRSNDWKFTAADAAAIRARRQSASR